MRVFSRAPALFLECLLSVWVLCAQEPFGCPQNSTPIRSKHPNKYTADPCPFQRGMRFSSRRVKL